MLRCSYPWSLKRRIMSRFGTLNDDSMTPAADDRRDLKTLLITLRAQ